MIELFEQELKQLDRHSSKGNQLKWEKDGVWYKADYMGYEGLSEFVISNLLIKSSLDANEFAVYEPEQIKYKTTLFNGAKSRNFLEDDWQIITLERFYKNYSGNSLYESIWKIRGVCERIKFLVSEIERLTGLKEFGTYLSKLLTLDAVFLNEDRHLHNIAILMNGKGQYELCPIFDNGGALLSDSNLDYPLREDVYKLIGEVKSKTVSTDFDEQLDACEKLFGNTIQFSFTKKDVDELLLKADNYDPEIIERVRTITYCQMKKYAYLFK